MRPARHALGRWTTLLLPCLGLAGCGGGGDASSSGSNAPTYTIGGSVTGLASSAMLVLQDNGADNTNVTANGTFTFATKIASDGAYAVTVLNQPTGQTCVVSSGSGTAAADVTNVTVACTNNTPQTYSIGGTVSSLESGATLVLQDNGGDNLNVTVNGTFTFATKVATGAAYRVSVLTQPAAQNCTVGNGAGTVTSAAVTNVQITCTASANTIFYDDFSGTSLSSAWTIIQRHGEYSQGETECNTAGAISVLDSAVSITTSAVAATCGDDPVPAGIYPAYPGMAASSWPYTTGDIQWTNFSFTFGTITFRAKFPPSDTNTWPAIWLLGANCQASNILTGNTSYNGDAGIGNCPNFSATYAEEDLVECAVNEAGSGTWCHFAYWTGASFGFCNINLDANWHVFQFVWNSTSITEYLDGTQVCQITAGGALAIPQQPMFLIIQAQTGGPGGTPDDANLPATLQVDYVKVTQP